MPSYFAFAELSTVVSTPMPLVPSAPSPVWNGPSEHRVVAIDEPGDVPVFECVNVANAERFAISSRS